MTAFGTLITAVLTLLAALKKYVIQATAAAARDSGRLIYAFN